MRIYLNRASTGAWQYITTGMMNALIDRGHTVARWDGTLDAWNAFDPDLYIGSNGHQQNFPSNRRAKLALQVSPYGNTYIPRVSDSLSAIQWTIEQNPDVVFGFGQEHEFEYWENYTKIHKLKWVSMPTAGDKTFYRQIVLLEERTTDVVYLGGRWPYKALTIDEYLLPILQDKTIKCSLKGWGQWPEDISYGPIEDEDVNTFFNTGKIGPCISEQHTLFYGIDIPERAWKVALSGLLVVHDPATQLKKMMPSALVAANPKEYRELIRYYLKNDDERIALVRNQQKEVLANHTYHHRLAKLFLALGLNSEASNMLG